MCVLRHSVSLGKRWRCLFCHLKHIPVGICIEIKKPLPVGTDFIIQNICEIYWMVFTYKCSSAMDTVTHQEQMST